MNEKLFVVEYDGEESQRLDKFLVSTLPEYSRSRLQRLIKNGLVDVNDQTAHKSGQMLDGPATVKIRIPPPEAGKLIPESIPLDIIYENDDVILVNKPAGMVVHPAAGHSTGTLAHAVLGHAPEMEGVGGEKRPGIVHRLDKNTSGLILLAKNDRTHQFLQNQFSQRTAKKNYLALVDGHPPTPTGRVEASIGRHPQQRKRMAIVSSAKGRKAVSEYSTIESFQEHAYLNVKPVTGRTHQIRLHMTHIGCPITGDSVYGRRKPTISLDRHFLHAAGLTIQLPDESEPRDFSAPLPGELEGILNELRRDSRHLVE